MHNKLKNKLREYKNKICNDYTQSINDGGKPVWSSVKKLLSQPDEPYNIRLNNNWVKTDKEKAYTFAEHLDSVFTPFPDCDKVHSDRIQSLLCVPRQCENVTKVFSPNEVFVCLRNMPSRKAPGFDKITGEIISRLPKRAAIFLCYIFNATLRMRYFPKMWKKSVIVMVHKPGKPRTEISSYRPISLLSSLSKVLEKLILNRIGTIIKSRDVLPNHQFGFRTEHATIQQCHRLVDAISLTLENREICSAVFLDVTQAFDKVWHPGLLYKMRQILDEDIYQLLKSYLTERSFVVRINDSFSEEYSIRSSVPQGSLLGPVLYSIFTADIPTSNLTLLATFADDIAILASNMNVMHANAAVQNHLSQLEKWASRWRISFNPTKCRHILFTNRRGRCPTLTFDSSQIPQVECVRYLGMLLDKRLTWRDHVEYTRRSVIIRAKQLRPLLGRKSILNLAIKRNVYLSVIAPIWRYGLELYGTASRSNLCRIQQQQSKILRTIASAPYFVSNDTLHADLNVSYVKDVYTDQYRRFFEKLQFHSNPLVRRMFTGDFPARSSRRLRRKWCRDALPIT